MRLPEIQAQMLEVARFIEKRTGAGKVLADWELDLLANGLRIWESEIYRRKPKFRAPKKSNPMTPAMKQKIWQYMAAHPTASQQEAGAALGIIAGRVSETIRGKRT